MSKTGKTQTERRNQSDEKIKKAAIKCFGEFGYSSCTINIIAREAGITKGLIVQRYESKDNLLFIVFKEILTKCFIGIEEYNMLLYSMVKLIDKIKLLKESRPDEFQFCLMTLTSKDIPKEFLEKRRGLVSTWSICHEIKEAQKKGIIPDGDAVNLVNVFFAQTFSQIEMCNIYGLPYPEDERFLEILHITNEEKNRIAKQREAILDSFCKAFTDMSYIYISNNQGERIRKDSTFEVSYDSNNIRRTIQEYIKNNIVAKDQKKMVEFYQFDTLRERIKDNHVICETCFDNKKREYRHYIMPVKYDTKGEIIEAFVGVVDLVNNRF